MRHGRGRSIQEPKAHTRRVSAKSRIDSRRILALDPHDPVVGQTDIAIDDAKIW